MKKTKIIATIEARLGSNRLPNKVLKKIGKKSILEIIIERLKKSKLIDQIVIATTKNIEDDRICHLAKSKKVSCYRGSEFDVLDRIANAISNYKGDLIVQLKDRNIVAPFDGVLGYRGITGDILGSDNSIIITLDDNSILYSDIKIPETFASFIKKDLPVKIKFSGMKNKVYDGKIYAVSSRINAETRSLLTRVIIQNENSELIPGSLLEINVNYNERNSLGIPDTSMMVEGSKYFVYKVSEDNIANKIEIEIGIRNNGFIEIVSGLDEGEIIIKDLNTTFKDSVIISLNDTQLIIDNNKLKFAGYVSLDFIDVNNFYAHYQINRNYRKNIKKINFGFLLNLDDKFVEIDNLKVNGNINQTLEVFLNNFNSNREDIFNRIILRNSIKNFLKNF